MKNFLFPVLILFSTSLVAQEEVITPLMYNTSIAKQVDKTRAGNSIDSMFTYVIDTLDVPVFDDFSINRFEQYDADYGDANVTSQYYYHLMNVSNTVPQNPTFIFCDSTHARHDTISMVGAVPTITSDYFSANSVWVNDLSYFPVQGQLRTLYQECYVLIDSIIDGVPDTDQDTIYYTSAPDFVQDSAAVFTVTIDDTTRIWVDNFAYHNYRYGYNPWSLGVATFDGIDENGWPYDWGNISAHEKADVLTSKPINLGGKVNVYLTFLLQPEGYGDAPEANDSLILEWWLPDSSAWYASGWYVIGGSIPNDVWDTAHVAVTPAALDNGFRFRFRNWANTSGNLDHWHIDYVNLIANDLPTVSYFNDLAISKPINSLLNDYTSVPWDHYKALDAAGATSKMLDTAYITSYNSQAFTTGWDTCRFQISYGGVPESAPFALGNPVVPGWSGGFDVGISNFPFSVSTVYSFSDAHPGAQAHFDVKANIGETVSGENKYDFNDTTYFTQKFDNYYSYDDGSAEVAYGITGAHGMLAYKFAAYEADTLTGVLMHFMPTVQDMSANVFLLTVWDDSLGIPNNIIYQDDYFNTNSPEYSGAINGFRYYTFQDGQYVKVPETFYVGWEQIEAEALNIGMDRNIPNSTKIFYNVTGTWQNSSQQASLLIRPVFSTGLNYTLSEEEITEQVQITIFPNPALHYFNIVGVGEIFTVTLYDLSGRAVTFTQNETTVDISELNSGLYIIDIRDENGLSLYTGKIIKEHNE